MTHDDLKHVLKNHVYNLTTVSFNFTDFMEKFDASLDSLVESIPLSKKEPAPKVNELKQVTAKQFRSVIKKRNKR